MRLPNIDHLLEDFPSIAEAHQHYCNWIDDNLSENRLEHIHASPYEYGKLTEHACECVFLLAYQRGSSLALSRLRARLPEATQALYGQSIELPEIHVFVGETNSGFSVVRREDACAIKLDFRMAMILTLSQFFLGVSGGTSRTCQLATWLMLAVVLSQESAFDPVLIHLAHEANAMDPGVFGDLIGSVADLVIQHEVGHVVAEQLPSNFTNLVYLPRERLPPGKRVGAGFTGEGSMPRLSEQPMPEWNLHRLVLPTDIEHWDREVVADCFSIFAGYVVCLEVYDGDRRRAIEAVCDAFLSWNLTFFAVWSLQHLKAEAMGLGDPSDPAHASHPDGLTRCDIALIFLNHLMARTHPEHRSPALTRSFQLYRKLWSGPIEQRLHAVRTYLIVAPEACGKFVSRVLQGVLSGCLYDEFKGVSGRGRLHANILEMGDHWDNFQQTSCINGRPVFVEMADELGSLEVNFVSEERT